MLFRSPAISQDLGADQRPWFFHSIKLFGLGESDVEKQVPDLIARDRLPRVGITVSKATITLRIAHQSESQAAFLTEIQPTVDLIEKEFGEFIFGTGEDELQDVVHHLLRTQAKTLSLLEIGSGPWIAHLLSLGFDPSPSYGLQSASWVPHLENGLVQSSIGKDFRNKVILDTLDLKELLCNIALQHRIDTNTDYTLVAGVYPASSSFNPAEGLPNCKFQVAIAKPKGAVHHSVHRILGHPELFYQRLAKTALNTLRKELLDDQS